MKDEMSQVTKARLTYVTPPTDEQIEGVKKFLVKKLGAKSVELECVEDKSIGSGFVISTGNHEFDWSAKGRMARLLFSITTLKVWFLISEEMISVSSFSIARQSSVRAATLSEQERWLVSL